MTALGYAGTEEKMKNVWLQLNAFQPSLLSEGVQAKPAKKRPLALSVLLMHMRTDENNRFTINQLVMKIIPASLLLIIRAGASV